MRFLPFILLLSSINAAAEIVPGSPVEEPTDVQSTVNDLIVKLGANTMVHFHLSGDRATSMETQVAGRRSVFQLDTCVLPREIRVEGMELIRDDLGVGERRTGTVTLLFDVGSEKDRRFGTLPRISITWTEGQLVQAWLIRKVGPNEATTSPLCYPDVQPTPRSSGRVGDKVPSSGRDVRAAQLNR